MKTILDALLACVVVGAWLWLKYRQAKHVHTRDLGDGSVQKLFDDDSKNTLRS
jgi:hypothetical protein